MHAGIVYVMVKSELFLYDVGCILPVLVDDVSAGSEPSSSLLQPVYGTAR